MISGIEDANIEDETNFESDYTRNYLRNEIFPLLTKKWPNIVKNLVNFSKSATEDNDYIENNLNDDAMIIEDKINFGDKIVIDIENNKFKIRN